MTAYPQDFPLAESVEVVQILRKNEVKLKLPLFARHLWTLQGYAMKATVGDPDAPVTAPTPVPTAGGGTLLPPTIPDLSLFSVKPDDFDPVEALDKLNVAFSSEVAPQFIVPWKLILKWALEELVQVVATAS